MTWDALILEGWGWICYLHLLDPSKNPKCICTKLHIDWKFDESIFYALVRIVRTRQFVLHYPHVKQKSCFKKCPNHTWWMGFHKLLPIWEQKLLHNFGLLMVLCWSWFGASDWAIIYRTCKVLSFLFHLEGSMLTKGCYCWKIFSVIPMIMCELDAWFSSSASQPRWMIYRHNHTLNGNEVFTFSYFTSQHFVFSKCFLWMLFLPPKHFLSLSFLHH